MSPSVSLGRWWKRLFRLDADSIRKGMRFALWGGAGALIAEVLTEMFSTRRFDLRASAIETIWDVGVWFACIGGCISTSIALGLGKYLRGRFDPRVLWFNLPFGGLAGGVSGAAAQGLFLTGSRSEALRIFCWGLAGALLGVGLSWVIPNLGRLRGGLAGAIGGWIGGAAFVVLAGVSEAGARSLGVATIGFFIGLVLLIVEAVTRETWLVVEYGLRERRTVSLGSEPVLIGSRGCTVYVPNAPPQAHVFTVENCAVFLYDGNSKKEFPVNSAIRIGKANVTLHTSATPAVALPPRNLALVIPGRTLQLYEGARFTASDLKGLAPSISSGNVAEVVPHPRDSAAAGLRNLSTQTWSVKTPANIISTVSPGQTFRIERGLTVAFGLMDGEIR